MRPIVTYQSNDKAIADYQNVRKNVEGEQGRPDEFLPSAAGAYYGYTSPKKSAVKAKFVHSPTEDNKRPDEWLGGSGEFNYTHSPPKRSWKVKDVKAAPIPFANDEE